MPRIGAFSAPGAGLGRGRAATGSVAGGGTVTVSVPFTQPLVNLNFTASATVDDASGRLRVLAVIGVTTSAVSVLVGNSDALNATSGTVHVLAIPD